MKRRPNRPQRPEAPQTAPHGNDAPAGHVAVGVVSGLHGVRGQVRIKPFTAAAEDVAAYGPVVTRDGRRFDLTVEGAARGVLIVRIKGIETRNAAETLKGTMLYVPRTALPEPEEDEFYYADLIGLEAVTAAGETLGRVVAVHDFGAGDLIEIALAADERTVLAPFTRENVPQVDLVAGRLTCNLPEELLEPGAPRKQEEGPS